MLRLGWCVLEWTWGPKNRTNDLPKQVVHYCWRTRYSSILQPQCSSTLKAKNPDFIWMFHSLRSATLLNIIGWNIITTWVSIPFRPQVLWIGELNVHYTLFFYDALYSLSINQYLLLQTYIFPRGCSVQDAVTFQFSGKLQKTLRTSAL